MRQLNGHRRAVSLQLLFVLLLSGAIAHAQPNLSRDRGRPVVPGAHGRAAHEVELNANVSLGDAEQLWIDLPDAPDALADRTDFQGRKNGAVWRGKVPAVADSDVVLTRHKG